MHPMKPPKTILPCGHERARFWVEPRDPGDGRDHTIFAPFCSECVRIARLELIIQDAATLFDYVDSWGSTSNDINAWLKRAKEVE